MCEHKKVRKEMYKEPALISMRCPECGEIVGLKVIPQPIQKEEVKLTPEEEKEALGSICKIIGGISKVVREKHTTPSDTFIEGIQEKFWKEAEDVFFGFTNGGENNVYLSEADNETKIYIDNFLKSSLQEQSKEIRWRDSLIYDLKEIIKEKDRQWIEKIKNKIIKYKNYYNPIGDEINNGRNIACDELLKELLK